MDNPRQRIVVDAVAFDQVFRFHRVLSAVTQAMQPPRLLVALFTVIALIAVGELWDRYSDRDIPSDGVFAPDDAQAAIRRDEALRPLAERYREWYVGNLTAPVPANIDPELLYDAADATHRSWRMDAVEAGISPEQIAEEDRRHQQELELIESYMLMGPFEATIDQSIKTLLAVVDGVLHLAPAQVFATLTDLFVRMPVALWQSHPWYTVVFGLIALLILAIGGGALCRMAACQFAGRERLRARDGMQFAVAGWVRLFLAPILPLIICGFLTVVLIAMGALFFNIPWLDVLGGLGYGINLLLGFIIAFILLTLGFSFILLLPAVATENCGPADALQRAIAYLLSRPLHLLGYVIIGIFGLTIGYLVVSLVIAATLNITGAATGALAFNSSAISIAGDFWINDMEGAAGDYHDTSHESWAASLISLWQALVVVIVAAYIISYLFSASTIIYLLMRKAVDDQDPSEIWRPGLVPGTLAPMPGAASVVESVDSAASQAAPAAEAGGSPSARHLRRGKETLGDQRPDVEDAESDEPEESEDDRQA